MCGITGCIGEDKARIERMTDALKHRGPDGNAVFVGNGISFGHARLAILDPRPIGDQPMWNEDQSVVIVFNGEIFNYRELREKEGLSCKTNTDTEVLLKLYKKHGIGFVKKLRGMFAFGLYDLKTKALHLARDHKGIKPFFLAYPNGRPAFASEMRSLMAAMPTKPKLNYKALSQYLRLQYVPGPHTLCEGIEQVPPGVIISWANGKETRTAFAPENVPTFKSEADAKARLIDVIDDSVHAHLVSDKPLGIFLSGGMDSSVVLHHMAKHMSEKIRTFTVRFEATEKEGAKRFNTDAELAKMTSAHYGTTHTEILLTAKEYRDLYKDTARALDQPNADSVSVAQFLLSREAKKHADVVLSGAGGDELFGGYPRYRIARILDAMKAIPPSLRGLSGKLLGYPSDVLKMQPGPALAERLLARPSEEGTLIAKGNWFNASATSTLFEDRYQHVSDLDPVRAFMEFDRHLWLVDESLRLADATTMGSGLECRVPFVDEHVTAGAHAISAKHHVTFKRTKAVLKEAYRGILPDHLYTLPKASFYPPLAKWLRRETAPLVEEACANKHIQELFDVEAIRNLYKEHCSGGYHLHSLSTIIQLACWFETVYDAA